MVESDARSVRTSLWCTPPRLALTEGRSWEAGEMTKAGAPRMPHGSGLRVLVTGASGYVGGRLAPALLDAGCEVRCLARTPGKLDDATWRPMVGVVAGSVGDDLSEALRGIDVAVYLVHSIGQGPDWAMTEEREATNFARYAALCGVSRIVYLGGLGRDVDKLSTHLHSRHVVGRALASSGAEVVEIARGRGHWCGFGQLRDAPLSRGRAPHHGDAPMGHNPLPAHRHQPSP